MPGYMVYVIAGVSAVVLAAAGALLGRYVWARVVRSRVVALVGHFEAVAAGQRHLGAVVTHLASAPDEELVDFATNAAQEDRRILIEIADRMRAQTEELMAVALPKALWPTADLLADAAWSIEREARRAGGHQSPTDVLEGLGDVDLLAVRDAVSAAAAAADQLREAYGIEETVVYGGGLYI